MKLILYDEAKLSKRTRTKEGYLLVEATLGRSGAQVYKQREVYVDAANPEAAFIVWRPEEEVFDPASMTSFAMKPVTLNHPGFLIDVDNFADHAVGFSGDTVWREGDFLKGTLLITDKRAIREIENGRNEVSLGYELDMIDESGVAPDGTVFDGYQTNIRGNHIALVHAGRCGGECRLDDSLPDDLPDKEDHSQSFVEDVALFTEDCACGGKTECGCQGKEKAMTGNTNLTKSVLVDGLSVLTDERGAVVIERMKRSLDDSRAGQEKTLNDMYKRAEDHAAAIAEKDKEIVRLRELNSPEKIAQAADERVKLLVSALDFLPADYIYDNKTNVQIAKDAVEMSMGADVVKGRSDDYVMALFDSMIGNNAPQQTAQPVFAAPQGGRRRDANDNGYSNYVNNLTNRWKGEQAKA